MRQRFNRNALCSSGNYKASRAAHQELLSEKHNTFVPVENTDSVKGFNPFKLSVVMVCITVFGKKMMITKDEYNAHCSGMKYQYV